MKKIFSIAMLLSALTFMVSCEDDKQEYVKPVFDKLVLTPSECNPGDSVSVLVKPSVEGDNWYFFKFNFSVGGNSVFAYMKETGAAWGSTSASCKFIAPQKPGLYTVTFTGTISPVVGSKLYDDAGTCSATLTVLGDPEEEEEEE